MKDHSKFEAVLRNYEDNATGKSEERKEFCHPIGRKRAKAVDSCKEFE